MQSIAQNYLFYNMNAGKNFVKRLDMLKGTALIMFCVIFLVSF